MTIENVLEILPESYLPADQELLEKAYRLAAKAHRRQKRASGEPYINHCVAVASILIELRVPPAVVAAGLLHDTVEDTKVSLKDIKKDFGDEIARLVDGVTKLSQLPRVSRGDRDTSNGRKKVDGDKKISRKKQREQATRMDEIARSRQAELASETLRKTFLAMGEDVRVVLIKLADRLHNMRTLGYLPIEKQKRVAKETLDIFAPLASRLGIWQMKWELEDLSFRYAEPDKYKEIAASLAERRSSREHQMADIVDRLEKLFAQNNIQVEISGRPKHIYSIFRKMVRKGVPFDMVHDVRGVRIIVPDIPACYAVLGIIHTHWSPIPGEFDDYIASPKDNFYQSLHTAVVFDDGNTLEVQIRTSDMHQGAEFGIAAHWRYKEGTPRDEDYERRVIWLRQIMEWMQDVEDATEFVDSMKTDVFSDRVYAFTPLGDIIDLPAGSTPIDFAYHVHTEIGHRCRGAKVNGKLVSLDYTLKTGDKVEIITAKRGGPSRDWLNPNLKLVNTQRVRSKIRRWFKHQDRQKNITLGKQHLDREFRRLSIADYDIEQLRGEFNFNSSNDLLAAIGCGDLSLSRVVNYVAALDKELDEFIIPEKPPSDKDIDATSIHLQGLTGMLTTMAKCCNPVPGDDIVGYITRGRGATIHREDCPNVLRIKDRERLAQVSWGEPKSTYPVGVRIKAYDRDGLLRDVSTLISDESINIRQVSVSVQQSQAILDLTLEVGNINQLSRVLTRVETLPNVMEARRVKPG
ncbi:MAG: bifunctional (p)ppGpp synthetase/guanosine-3',5'-bis(diphosphate) 3'-pyrophosphohydrolase [Anaerolineae bacterium]|nr:bifunctional (p)ppGpp synthetase/guanosine-3',5'-bis(diphosphate) 3'-pyrophosphohydrolase [Anaerolineae bacterium]